MKTIELIFDNVLLKGLILKREKYYIEVQLISPFEAWKNYGMISGMCRATPNHLLTEYGDKTIRRLLIESYQKSKILYDSFDRISNVYTDHKVELISLNEISDIKIKSKIKRKLEDWFFNAIFTSSITGVIASNNDRNYIFEILENHLKQNENKEKGNEYGIWLEKLIEYLNKRGLKL
jgi:hypothetical protein